jgi:hypothetical protein
MDKADWQCGGQGFESPQLHKKLGRASWDRR